MKIESIITNRFFRTWRSWQIVYEWEDIFRKEMNVPLSVNFDNGLHYRLGRIYDTLPISFFRYRNSFIFEMQPIRRNTPHNNSSKVVPCIIDWYLRTKEDIDVFFKKFSKHRLIIVTSKEAYDFLVSIDSPVPFGHLPLSLSDKYRVTPETCFSKDIDIVLMGRQNPVLLNWLEEYCKAHPGLTIVSSQREKDNYRYYTQDGVYVSSAITRDQCMNLLKRSRVGLYSTKGMDNDYLDFDTNGFSQVTPRLFEYMATGNHIIARYPLNADTKYYNIPHICPHTDSYDSFVHQMDVALNKPVDMKIYSEYLEHHYTSTRVPVLIDLVKDL